MSTTAETRTVIENYIRALQSGEAVDRRHEFFTEDATWTLAGDLPTSGTWTGPDGIFHGFLPAMLERFDTTQPMSQEVRAVLADGDRAVAEWTTRATTTAGEPYINDVVIAFRVTNGRIAEAREYFDTAYARRLLFATN
ncbi:nuclear transport factor 2 family protein [Nocardia sp. CDC160]|uniref:nuclear transport factor 2 family protein n=1 Tax=Nocardia sp. CDC160 TaxID=3112166 RepID=UPI002DBF2B34|nr:nuclear transport factor 2 family protein [Nocardia sp. CDC160]MEC3916910.1 nuclear transport factor 2 family protein [Nocardia sp. CDC160]